MDIMAFMEAMGTSNIAFVSAFFIGLMTAISPCPLATNIAAIAFVSRKINNNKNTLLVGLTYTFGRMLTYVFLASVIVWFGANSQILALTLHKYGDKIIGPLLLILGIFMLNFIKLPIIQGGSQLLKLKERLAKKGFLGSFLLGVLFALAFCPFSGVLFFGMLIPLAIKNNDGIIIPSIFAFATGLPVILFSIVLVYSISKLGRIMNKVQTFEKWMRKFIGAVFVVVGLYYLVNLFL